MKTCIACGAKIVGKGKCARFCTSCSEQRKIDSRIKHNRKLHTERRQISGKYPAKKNCFAYVTDSGRCRALQKLYCSLDGVCPFYKLKDRVV